jgi:Fe-S-cluster containining protein
MSKEKIILSLRDAIPPVMCRPRCTDCCGAVPWSHWEWNQVPAFLKEGLILNEALVKPPIEGDSYRKVILPFRFKVKGTSTIVLWNRDSWMQLYTKRPIKANKCVFLTEDESGCRVYQYRPIICRLFGTIMDKRAACKHGCSSIPQLHWTLGMAMATGWFTVFEKA